MGFQDGVPYQLARTLRFTAGAPGNLTISPDGRRVLFTRSASGSDPRRMLWLADARTGEETLVADASRLSSNEDGVPLEELARRERARERSTGITAYSTDKAFRAAVFAAAGRLWTADLGTLSLSEIPTPGPVIDPRLDPTGARTAYVTRGALHVTGVGALATPESEDVTYGLAEFVAAEEMRRDRGFWWSPDGQRLVVERVDNSPTDVWYISDPIHPTKPPYALRYPLAGKANADVTLFILGLDGSRTEIEWDRKAYEYVVAVHWGKHALVIAVQNRPQTSMLLLKVDPETGATQRIREDSDAAWVDLTHGTPDFTSEGELVWTVEDVDGTNTRHLIIGDERVTPPGLQVRHVLDVDGDTVLFQGSTDPAEVHLWTFSRADGLKQLTHEPGLHHGRMRAGTLAVRAATLTATPSLRVNGTTIRTNAETPLITPKVEFLQAGEHAIRTAVVLPSWHEPGSGSLPVLMDPYGGPASQRAVADILAYLLPQWFADQGFAVVIADGRGTPGRGPRSDRSIHLDKATLSLDDQITALHAAAAAYPDLDLSRVGIRGWSYGGFLAALAVLRRPDVFHAAVAGAPVTDQRLYDTYYSERYLGHPDEHPEAYLAASLLDDAPKLSRPLMLIHGLADDNVVAAHTLKLSAALLEAGRPHTVLPLSGATHMGGEPGTFANMVMLQAEFLRDALSAAQRSSISGIES
ncbi:MAG TPA: prolyl oligopeptidase family serine peptidase [Candidatus Limnocylindrales bacterium]|nr:prolyl oligopeptidase family serine peptidase [Candidatus Limnocylindrales bacterium]